MASFSGTVRHNDLEGGFFELHTGGKTYRLQGATGLEAGAKVVVHGTIESGGFGLQMSGPAIKVDKIDPA
ncbi:MAG: hypothetical protein ACRBN8_04400 [Nannocystales bacterium]